MTHLKPIKHGWTWLQNVLNKIIAGVNERGVYGGTGIHCAHSEKGTIISLQANPKASDSDQGDDTPEAATSTSPAATGGDGLPDPPEGIGAPGWTLMNVVFETSDGYVVKQAYVWMTPLV
jgi:hypothetical protein